MSKPLCCGQPAKWVHFNHRMEYWFCDKCKKEVQEKKAPETSDDDNNIWYSGLAGYTPPAAGSYKRTTLINFSGGLGGAGSLGAQPGTPQPMGSGEVAQFTNGIDTPCYNNHIHCWTGKTSYDMGIACTCGQRVKLAQSSAGTLPGAPPHSTWPAVAAAELKSATLDLAGLGKGSRKILTYNGYLVTQTVLVDCFERALTDQGLQGLFIVEVDYDPTTDEYKVKITKNY
jgi:hypothetical protein